MPNENIDIRVRMRNARAAAAEARGVGGAVGGIGKKAKETERHTRGMGRGFVYARKGIGPLRAGVSGLAGALGFGAGVGLIGAFKVMNDEARESQKTGRATSAVLKSTGSSAWISRKQIEGRATKLSEMSAVDDEVIQKSENMLLTFREIRNEQGKGNKIFDRTNKAALDMAAGFTAAGKEMSPTDAALQLGKAVNDPVKGMTRLTRVGVTFTKQQTDQVAAMVKNGDKLGAQKVILGEINKEFGGQAKSQADPMKRLGVIMHNTAETLGLKLLPYIDKGAKKLGTWVKQVTDGTGQGGRFRDQVVKIWKAVKPVVLWFGRAAKNVAKFTAEHPDLAKMAGAAFLGYRAFKLLGGVKLVKLVGWIIKLRKAGKAANVAEAVAANLGTMPSKSTGPLRKFRGFFKGRMGLIGKVAGAAAVASFIAQLTGLEDADPFLFLHPPNTSEPKGWHHYMHKPGGPGSRKRYPDLKYNSRGEAIGNRIPRSQRRRDPHGAPGASVRPRVRVAEPAMPGGAPPELPGLQVFIDGRETARSTARWTDADRNRR